jgi:hypothetical protein
MENINNPQEQPPFPKTKEAIFADILRTALYEIKQDMFRLDSFDFGNKKIPVRNVASAVMAVGQLSRKTAQAIYTKTLH